MQEIKEPRKKPRGQRCQHCDQCGLYLHICICDYQPQIRSKVQYWLLMHPMESRKPTNTGKLIANCIDSTKTFIWDRLHPPEEFIRELKNPQYRIYLIFPDDFTEDKSLVTDYVEEDDRIPVFLILDGTWKQARKIYRRSEYLQRLLHLPLIPQQKSRYTLRRASREHHLCTVEVAVELLSIAGEEGNAEKLQTYFDCFNAHYLAGRNGHEVKFG
ncbi:MAG: DTW domain-containing protein [SAR324 cluster bacterium]|uniref:tRNA-uridine aminocarboxypropyltransferase n=1 Tax=SAR324 cluster bacterium TaxID=2024889 RepID=A0A2A4T6U0_9DELT|nr:MAG: DTW domain-containing protein [SAR324 cluster bacterium]